MSLNKKKVLPEMVNGNTTSAKVALNKKGNSMLPQMTVVVNEVEVHLVSVDGKIFANSLEVAAIFEKEHRRVLQDIREFSERALRNFVLKSYISKNNKSMPMYEMNRDGFMFLAMGFTGDKAENFKLDLIDAFNEMERQINQPKILSIPEQIAIIAKGNQIIDERLTVLEKTKRLEAWQEKALQDAKNRKVYSFGIQDPDQITKLHRAVWRYLKKSYNIPRYNELPAVKFEEAVNVISNLTLIDLVA